VSFASLIVKYLLRQRVRTILTLVRITLGITTTHPDAAVTPVGASTS
jgi:hypothetical protein